MHDDNPPFNVDNHVKTNAFQDTGNTAPFDFVGCSAVQRRVVDQGTVLRELRYGLRSEKPLAAFRATAGTYASVKFPGALMDAVMIRFQSA